MQAPSKTAMAYEMPAATKRCTHCGLVKPLEEFSRVKKSGGKPNSWCKQCMVGNTARCRKKRPEHYRALNAASDRRRRARMGLPEPALRTPRSATVLDYLELGEGRWYILLTELLEIAYDKSRPYRR